MKTKKAIWTLKTNGREGLEGREVKRQQGLDYIKRLKKDEEVLEVIEDDDQFLIIMKDE